MLPDKTPISTATVEAAVSAATQLRGGVFAFPESADLVRAMGHDVSPRRLYQVLDAMVGLGNAVRLERGTYAMADALGRVSPLAIGGYLASDAFVSLWSAASYYGLTTQDVEAVSVVVPSRRRPILASAVGASFVFHVTTPDRIFGWHQEPVDGVFARLADVERVLIDLLYFEGTRAVPPASQILSIWEEAKRTGRVNPYVLVDYAKRMRSWTLARRVGLLMDRFDLGPVDPLLAWRTVNRHPIPAFRDPTAALISSDRWGIGE